ncbi:hypothetical protein E2F46_13425 [Luteimonas aestuarii]|uniref:Uncharacterized protein n=1 Tax=Luteimonas aestuarii TaxID=453837 RepID=A0A4R5TPB5_9GAMM|nr:hypothetical protein [Luteimonas aestuarii]TDK22752.1 hypothetical protein E2F46_13425 [Luteimonas aestuarii]
MPDATDRAPSQPTTWHDAFAALPRETPPAPDWNALAARLDARRPRARAPVWLATAAAVLLAVALPWRLQWLDTGTDTPVRDWPAATASTTDPLEALYAESAQLETLLAVARDDRMASGTAIALADELETRLATVDAALMQPGLTQEQRASLWQQRVEDLRVLAGFEGTRRWLAAQGGSFDAALVQLD